MTDVSTPNSGKQPMSEIPTLLRVPVQYWKQSVAVVVLVLLVAAGYALFGVYQRSQVDKAEQALGHLIASTPKADLVSALKAMAKTAPAGVRNGVNLELAKAAQAAGDFETAATAWGSISKDAPASMRAVAALGQASALGQLGQTAKAVTVLETLKADCPKAFVMTADRQLAITAETAGQWQKALDAYERLKASGAVQNPGFIDTRIAALKAKLAKPDNAKASS